HKGGEGIGLLDIDAPIPARFSEADEACLEDDVKVLETHL
ncbi:GAF domain-containing protein, partial [Staphylococcus pseudintermedius]